MCKKLLCVFILTAILCSPVNVLCANDVSFSLTDVTTEKNRLFETQLCVSDEVAAFTATLTFDENALQFRQAKALSDEAVISVNDTEEGKVKIAYLCENGATGELLSFTFKSSDKSSHIDLSAEQVIDTNANDLSPKSIKGAEISVSSISHQDKSKTESENSKPQTNESQNYQTNLQDESSVANTTLYLDIPPKDGTDLSLILSIAGGAVVVFMVAAVAFFLGKNSDKNKNNRKAQHEKDT